MSYDEKDHLNLKWGTLKEWKFSGDKARELLRRYHEIGSSYSAMAQHDTPEQVEIICALIDECPGDIYLDWDGQYVGKDEAKKYVREYPR
jgi:hypothetical protein